MPAQALPMDVVLAEWFVYALAAYALVGIAFASGFLARGMHRLDSNTKSTSFGFRLIVLPGVVAFWPFLLARLRQKGRG